MSTVTPASGLEPLTLNAFVQRIDEISTLPQIALSVLDVANDPDSGAVDLKEVIETDAALSARIIRCVNSSAFPRRTKTASLQEAIAYLGMKQIRNLAVTASVSELFKGEEKIGSYSRSQLWRHLVSVGICARLIALRRKIANFEDAFLAGLLHDIGIVLEDQYAHEQFAAVINSLEVGKTLAESERLQMGFDHTVLGEKVAAKWHFPEVTTASIRFHHASAGYRGEHIDIVRSVEVANLICTLKNIPSVGQKLVRVSQPALTGLSFTANDIKVLAGDLDKELAACVELFQI